MPALRQPVRRRTCMIDLIYDCYITMGLSGRDGRADSDAARFLAETVHGNPDTVSILATGSPANLLGAYRTAWPE